MCQNLGDFSVLQIFLQSSTDEVNKGVVLFERNGGVDVCQFDVFDMRN